MNFFTGALVLVLAMVAIPVGGVGSKKNPKDVKSRSSSKKSSSSDAHPSTPSDATVLPSMPPTTSPTTSPSMSPSTPKCILPSTPQSTPAKDSVTINFDDSTGNLVSILNGYMCLDWHNFVLYDVPEDASVGFIKSVTSPNYVAYKNYDEAASFSAQGTTVFSLLSMQATSAYADNNVLTINGYDGSGMVAEKNVTIHTTGSLFVDFDTFFTNLTKVEFLTSAGTLFVTFAMDDLEISFLS